MTFPSVSTIRATISSDGQIALPIEVRRALSLEAGDVVRFEPREEGFLLVAEHFTYAQPATGVGCEAAVAFTRELRGHIE
jgi:bifunctional DNA-binding transcriptional regulator/antitoxin component of YhaV-PrlF toxin-antitoxin module